MNQFDLVVNQELRHNMIERVEVLEQVKEILTLGSTEFVTINMTSEYYEISERHVKRCISENRDELESDGLKTYTYQEIKEMLKGDINVPFKIPPRGLTLIPKRALLRIGMLLRDSEIAKEVRTRILDIVHDAETQTDIVENIVDEVRNEQQISEDLMKAILEGDIEKESLLKTELIGLKNKRIAQLEDTMINSLTIKESRAVINKCVRTMGANKYNRMFTKAWDEFYRFANYKLNINVRARKGKGLDRFNDEEIKELERLAKSWAVDNGVKVDFKL